MYPDEQKNRMRGWSRAVHCWGGAGKPLFRFFCSSAYLLDNAKNSGARFSGICWWKCENAPSSLSDNNKKMIGGINKRKQREERSKEGDEPERHGKASKGRDEHKARVARGLSWLDSNAAFAWWVRHVSQLCCLTRSHLEMSRPRYLAVT